MDLKFGKSSSIKTRSRYSGEKELEEKMKK